MRRSLSKPERAALFRRRLAEAMAAAGTGRAALARAAGIDRSSITQMLAEGDTRLPGAQAVAGLAAALGVSADWLLGLSDRAELGGAVTEATLSISATGRATSASDQIFAWHEEARGYKIRHVPATLPDMLKTDAVMAWEYAPHTATTPGAAIAAAHARLDWMRGTTSDYEIAIPLHELESFATASGYYAGLPRAVRREQLDWFAEVHDQFYPGLRMAFYDARAVFSAPVTVFGPKIAAVYLGGHYIAFRDRARVRAISGHFDALVRAAAVSDRGVPDHLAALRARVA